MTNLRVVQVTQENEFSTTDLYMAAYFKTIGLPLLRFDRRSSQTVFVFNTMDENLGDLKASWYTGMGQVSAQDYASNIKTLKSAVHSG